MVSYGNTEALRMRLTSETGVVDKISETHCDCAGDLRYRNEGGVFDAPEKLHNNVEAGGFFWPRQRNARAALTAQGLLASTHDCYLIASTSTRTTFLISDETTIDDSGTRPGL